MPVPVKKLCSGVIYLLLCLNTFASTGRISGKLKIDDSWSPVVYLSYISSFKEMNTVSYDMIISMANIDSLGNFEMDISFLPKDDNLFRLHLVKKDYPANTLIIGGKDENHIFFIAKRDVSIRIVNNNIDSLFGDVVFEGYPDNSTFYKITKTVALSNERITSVNTLSKKELLEKAAYEKLRFIADTCTNSLVSLYAIYKSRFEDNYSSNMDYYKAYNKKWKNNQSLYFKVFRKELGITSGLSGIYATLGITTFLLVLLIVYLISRKKKKNFLADLSIQERKIFSLLQDGLTNQQISDECNIGISTVKSHVGSIYSKLNVKSRKEVMNLKE